ncbi:unnamed protein product [Ectocarpus sp. 4 AP-2014]
MMEPASHPCFRVNSRFAPLCFIPPTHRARPRPNEPWRLSRRKHRLRCSAAGARTAAEGDHDAYGGGGIGGGHEQAAARSPAPVQGWTARKGNESLNIKEMNFRRKIRVRKVSKRIARTTRHNSFISTAKVWGARGQWREVLRLLDKMAEDGIPLNSYAYNSALSSIAKSGRWREALALRDRMLSEGVILDGYTFSALIEACSKGGNVAKGVELLREMVDAGVARDCFSYNAALHGFVRNGDSKNALLMLEDMVADGVRPDAITYGTLLACCGNSGEWKLCMSLMDRMRSEGITPNAYSFSPLIKACGKEGRWALAVKTLEDMEASGPTPNEHNWLMAIGACGNAGQWEEALGLIDKLEALAQRGEGVPMSTTMYNFGIDACARAGRWDQGVALLERMKRNPATPPDAQTYAYLIDACAKDANLEDALAYLTEMRAVGLAPTFFAYVSAMGAIKVAGQWKEALHLLDEMAKGRLISDVFSFYNVVDAYGKDGQLARTLVQTNANLTEIAADSKNEMRSDADLNAWRAEKPDELVKRMENNGVELDVMSFNILIDACARGGSHWAAARLLKKMKSLGLRPNSLSYNPIIHSCRGGTDEEWRLALDLLDEMRKSGLTPDVISFNTAITSCAKAGDWRRSLDLFAGMKVEGVTPDILSYNAVISACAKGGQWRIGLELLAKVRADPTLEANQRTYTSAINCFQQFRGGQSVASLASTLAGQSSREEMLLDPIPTSDVYLGRSPGTPEGGKVGEEHVEKGA